MTETLLNQIDRLNEYLHLESDINKKDFKYINTMLQSMRNEAINYTRCCTELKSENNKLSFKDWKYSKGMRYLSGHTYKDNDGDIYDSDELEAMYENYLSF